MGRGCMSDRLREVNDRKDLDIDGAKAQRM